MGVTTRSQHAASKSLTVLPQRFRRHKEQKHGPKIRARWDPSPTRKEPSSELLCRYLMQRCMDLTSTVDVYEKKNRCRVSAALRHAVWIKTCGRVFEYHCPCCKVSNINVFNFHCAHIQAKSKGGSNSIDNLIAICALCNTSMGVQNLSDFQQLLHPKHYRTKPL